MLAAIGTSHAKTILLGEHAVVYGEPAIAIPISTIRLRAEITPQPGGQQTVTSAFYNGALAAAAHTNFAGVATLIRQLLVTFDAQDQGFNLNIISDLPPERGMGSSAATAVAIVRAFYNAFATDLPHAVLLRWADVSERQIHGNPSGIDAATVSATRPQCSFGATSRKTSRCPKTGCSSLLIPAFRGRPSWPSRRWRHATTPMCRHGKKSPGLVWSPAKQQSQWPRMIW
nr:hypothetical protein [Lacticaseibacillus sharpeae]